MDLGNQLIEMSKGFGGVWQLVFGVIGTILATCLVIEVSPLKFDPLKWLTKAISRSFKDWFEEIIDSSLDKQLEKVQEDNKKRDEAIGKMDVAIDKMDQAIEEINGKIDQMSDRMDENEKRAQKNHISLLRNSVLTYANNLRAGADPSKESFEYVLSQIDEYNDFVKTNKIENNCMNLSEALIIDQYKIRYNTIKKDGESTTKIQA